MTGRDQAIAAVGLFVVVVAISLGVVLAIVFGGGER